MSAFWELHARLTSLIEKRDFKNALIELRPHKQRCSEAGFSPIFVLEANCLAGCGDYDSAIAVLTEAAALDPANFWIFYNLGHYLSHVGRRGEALKAIWTSHRLLGWPESEEHGYEFTHDYFAGNIQLWRQWFATQITVKPIDCLEIGSWQGGASAWLLDKVVSLRGGSLTCIDTFEGSSEHRTILAEVGSSLEAIFDANIRRTGHASLCRKLVGRSQEQLRALPANSYDFIYIDGAHEAKFVIQDAVLSLPLLRPGGFILFDDVPFCFSENPSQNTARAIDFFVDIFAGEFDCVHRGYQALLRKKES